MLPCIRRALGPAQLQAARSRVVRRVEPPPREPQSRALPVEPRTWWGSWSVPTRRPPAYEAGALPAELQERNALHAAGGIRTPTGRAHDVLSVARLRFATAAYRAMAPAGIEPAARWASTSRSTGELQKPLRSLYGADGTRTRTPPMDSRVRFIALRLQTCGVAAGGGTTNE